ncbi:hypothetical protein [Thalassolituus oleivorans]
MRTADRIGRAWAWKRDCFDGYSDALVNDIVTVQSRHVFINRCRIGL